MKTFEDVSVVGMHFREREGVPAKAIVANFIPPVTLQLQREPDNAYDEFAIKVLYENQHIGYIEAGVAGYVAPWLDEGMTATCVVNSLIERKNNLYPNVTITVE